MVAVRAALHPLDSDVSQERENLTALPRPVVVDAVGGHRHVGVVRAGEVAVIVEAQRGGNDGGHLAVGERHVQVLGGGLVCEGVGHCSDPRVSETRGERPPVARVVEVHKVVAVLERQPLAGGEEVQRAEGRLAADDGLVAAELEHADDVGQREVEGGGELAQTLDDRSGVDFLVRLCRRLR